MTENIIEIMVPLLLIGIGALLAERSGITNIALEGFILWGAFSGFTAFSITGSFILTLGIVILLSLLPAGLFSLSVFRLNGDVFLSGLALNILLPGIISLFSALQFNTTGPIRLSGGTELPISSIRMKIIFIFLLILIIVTNFFLTKTHFGTITRITGENPRFTAIHFGKPERIRTITLIFSSLTASLAGMIISLRIGVYLPGISSGRGWIALILLYIGRKECLGFFLAVLFFSLAEAGAMELQGAFEIPGDLILGLPFFLALAALPLIPITNRFLQRNRT